MLTREQASSLSAGDIVDFRIVSERDHYHADTLIKALRGRTIRVVIEKIKRTLIDNDAMRDLKGADSTDPIMRTVVCQALNGEHLPAHILRINNDGDSQTTPVQLYDWCIMDFHVVGRTR